MNPQSAYEKRTFKIYESDGLASEFDATVIGCIERDGKFLLELDRTAFFPEGGGQGSDTGIINGADISFVGIEAGRIYHHADRPFPVGEAVHGAIDLGVRRRRMQNHGGEHIISGLMHSMYGVENAGFHMSEHEITIDTASPVSAQQLRAVEVRANEIIWDDRPIKNYYPDKDALAALEYRSKTEILDDIRIVEIENCDKCACCAPQLPSTGMIGFIRIKGFIKYKKGVRITAAAGADALDYLRRVDDQASEIARIYSTVNEDILGAVKSREEVFAAKLSELHELREKLLEARLSALEHTEKNIVIFEDGCDAGLLRKLANEGVKLTGGLFAAFSAREGGGYNYIIAARDGELSAFSAKVREALGGRGGGKGPMISGFVEADKESIEKFFEQQEG